MCDSSGNVHDYMYRKAVHAGGHPLIEQYPVYHASASPEWLVIVKLLLFAPSKPYKYCRARDEEER